ncbi:hypothetical protein AB0958_38830 [Streptomyces sp. NPDC006655]|uniref:WD40 repeat domain-containing protein n=1 Tax=Streptomyces sp. NPDC006655 TaxID=3156898 RepID=UPI0034544B2B
MATRNNVATLNGDDSGDQMPLLRFSPDGKRLAGATGGSAASNFSINLWDLKTHKDTIIKDDPDRPFHYLALAFSPDSNLFAFVEHYWNGKGGEATVIKVMNIRSNRYVTTIGQDVDRVYDVAFSSDGTKISGIDSMGGVHIWDVKSGHKAAASGSRWPHPWPVVTKDYTVELRDAGSGKLLHTLVGHTDAITDAVWGGGDVLATSSSDYSIRLWDSTTGRMLRSITLSSLAGESPPEAIALAPDNASLCYGSTKDNKLWLHETGMGAS